MDVVKLAIGGSFSFMYIAIVYYLARTIPKKLRAPKEVRILLNLSLISLVIHTISFYVFDIYIPVIASLFWICLFLALIETFISEFRRGLSESG